ncbi:hypothetical protein HanPI659440_Chr11g0423421 [Helianthus annuus]|nr:hypothetical protein HanPI659440_Chr11g0423421 [Helianthus annuus]
MLARFGSTRSNLVNPMSQLSQPSRSTQLTRPTQSMKAARKTWNIVE